MKTVNLTRKTDELSLILTTNHSASSYGLPVAILGSNLVDAIQEIGPGITVADAVKARALDLCPKSYRFRLSVNGRKFCQQYLSQNPTGPQIPAHMLKE